MKTLQHYLPWWEPHWSVFCSAGSTLHTYGIFAAEPESDDPDSEDGYFDGEDVGGLHEFSSEGEVHPDDEFTDGEYVLHPLPTSRMFVLIYILCALQSL
jgi:hypothetical protein